MTFEGHFVYLHPHTVICGPSTVRDANDTLRAQITIPLTKIILLNHFIVNK